MTKIQQHNANSWTQSFGRDIQQETVQALERGEVIFLPNLGFQLLEEERALLTPDIANPKNKNICYDASKGRLHGHRCTPAQADLLTSFMRRYANYTTRFIKNLLPHYENAIQFGRTSFRPIEVLGRISSPKKDDTRLHVDAFPSTPMGERRILRIFTNINPQGKPRIWHLGESFHQVCERFLPTAKKPMKLKHSLLKTFRITKQLRTDYDHYMLSMHDNMKLDVPYQSEVQKIRFEFPPLF